MNTNVLTEIRTAASDLWHDYKPAVIATGVAFALVLGPSIWAKIPAKPAQEAPLMPVILVATGTPIPADVLDRAVIAFDNPNGNPIGAIEPGRHYALVARSGPDWLQANVDGSGLVWLRAADLGLAADVPDIATPQPPAVMYVTVPQPVYVPVEAPAQAQPAQDAAVVNSTHERPNDEPGPGAEEWHAPMVAPADPCADWYPPKVLPAGCVPPAVKEQTQ